MHTEQDLNSLYDFLKNTPEGNLKKMLVQGKFSEAGLMLVLKVVRGCTPADFVKYANENSLPKMKYTPAQAAMKETVWPQCLEVCSNLGLIAKPTAAPKAA